MAFGPASRSMAAAMASRVLRVLAAAEHVGAVDQPQADQEFALAHDRPRLGAGGFGGAGERGEIDVGGEVRLAGLGERVDVLVRLHRLQRVAGAGRRRCRSR